MATAENKQFLPDVSDKEIVKSEQAVHSMNHKRTLKPEKIIDSSSYISESTKRTNALRTREKQTISAYRFQENKKTRQDKPVKSRDKIYHKPPKSPRITRNKILRTLPKPSIDLNQSKSEIVAASTDTRSLKTLGIKEKRPKERRTKPSNLPKDIQGIIARRILTDSSNESQDKTANSNTGEFKNAKPQKPRRQDVTRSTISSKRKQKECKQFQSAPSLQNEKKIKKAPMNEEKLKPIHNPKLILGNAISRAYDQEEKVGKKEAEEAHALERGRSRTRRTRYDAMNSSTKLILLNNKCPVRCT
ncbi:hypothetical protein DPMN_007215 [Dreissena polymorpha]|uniref:Uncharacterized protein n=1 Tax=Dreissena polymorpha TaxID=45954 RepID=A0A9D4RVT5_DREPO|nr:hypothetical protein DPMN_007215 [Dreissena polymorpha]